MNLGIQGERERKQKANKTNETSKNSSVLPSGSMGTSQLFLTLLLSLAGPAPGAPAHPTFSNLPAESGAPHEGQRVLPCVQYPASAHFSPSTAISQIPRSPSFFKPPSLVRSEVGGCQVGLIAPGKEMSVPSSVQVGLKIVIFKETKLGHGDLGRPRAPEPTGEVPRCQVKAISEPRSPPNPTPQLPPPSSLARTSSHPESPSCSQEDKSPFYRSHLTLPPEKRNPSGGDTLELPHPPPPCQPSFIHPFRVKALEPLS